MIAQALAANGLILRGGFNFAAGETAPPGLSAASAKSVLLVGQAGAAPWPHFSRWRSGQPEELKNPLDTWSREVIDALVFKCDILWAMLDALQHAYGEGGAAIPPGAFRPESVS